ncbi:MAG: hypothetical protein WC477_01845 [Patescibacteria group bacterium]
MIHSSLLLNHAPACVRFQGGNIVVSPSHPVNISQQVVELHPSALDPLPEALIKPSYLVRAHETEHILSTLGDDGYRKPRYILVDGTKRLPCMAYRHASSSLILTVMPEQYRIAQAISSRP